MRVKYNTFLRRSTVIISLQYFFKIFDYSFHVFEEITWRGTYFSIYLYIFWMLVWYSAELLNKKIKKLNSLIKLLIHFFYGLLFGFLTNYFYRIADLALYNNTEGWEKNSIFNPEMSVSILMFYLIIYGFSIYFEKELMYKKLEKDNISNQLIILKSQLEPHFLFNSLGVLSSIIHTDTKLADSFILKLSKTLRYFIEKNKEQLSTVEEELILVENYFFLIKTRFPIGISLTNKIKDEKLKNRYIPSTSLQTLVENAIKHNKHNKEFPLEITIYNTENKIIIQNNINYRTSKSKSTALGIKNLKSRYALMSSEKLKIEKSEDKFTVIMPTFNKEKYDNINNRR